MKDRRDNNEMMVRYEVEAVLKLVSVVIVASVFRVATRDRIF